jgi:guanylate kinase
LSRVIVITGPSGVGKGTLIRLLRDELPELALSESATTRAPRPGEVEGVDYTFLSDERFDSLLREDLERRAAAGQPVVLEIEVQGARQIRDALPDALQVFIAPPSREALRERLVGRGTDDADVIARRLAAAEAELGAQDEFAHVVVNDRLEDAVSELSSIVRPAIAG